MATNTYVAIAETTLASNGGTVTFSNISQAYRDIRLVIKGGFVDSGFLVGARVGNSSVDSNTSYSYTAMRGNGSAATSAHKTGMSFGALCQQGGNDLNNLITVDFLNYSNTTTFKTWISRYANAGDGTDSVVSTWRSTQAIDTIAIAECGDGGSGSFNYGNMLAGTTFTLYGIGGIGGESAPKALGGEVFSDADYYYHLFRGAGTFKPKQSLTADILVVAGGGGSIGAGGGAGAGGLLGFASQSLTVQEYPVIVGAGGVKGYPGSGTPTNGSNSQFGTLTAAIGGAYGGGFTGAAYISAGSGGGSGGGAPFNPAGSATSGTSGQGNAGSTGYQAGGGGDPRSGGGGGGAGGAAPNGSANTGGNGGIGATYNSTVGGSAGPYAFINAMGAATGTGQLSAGNYYYAGGGGGEGKNYAGAAGLGGGGVGGTSEPATYPAAGTANTGGGAGAGPNAQSSYGGANGGSGVVIVRYAK